MALDKGPQNSLPDAYVLHRLVGQKTFEHGNHRGIILFDQDFGGGKADAFVGIFQKAVQFVGERAQLVFHEMAEQIVVFVGLALIKGGLAKVQRLFQTFDHQTVIPQGF
ncbi:MAG: hypothetical protein EBU49_03730 [Proteobacteria bacterium]|nr:hypothetical protein [Pseudomonadota bacterium]